MKYITEFRNGDKAKAIAEAIRKEADPGREYKFMEFCGGHTHAIHRYGISDLLPKNIELIHGPGCPVCVLPIPRINEAIYLSKLENVILCSYGDMLRVPGSNKMSLLKAKGEGADVRMVYSVDDALHIAKENPNNTVVFFAIGFETTTPPTAVAIQYAKEHQISNFLVFCNHILTPPALHALLGKREEDNPSTSLTDTLDGFIGPAHVSVIIGSDAYQFVATEHHKSFVVAGFEPLDLLHSVLLLIRQINTGRCEVENQYTRAVNPDGNLKSQQLINDVFEIRKSFEWRGLGWLPDSALKIRDHYRNFDAEVQFHIPRLDGDEHRACECASILRGVKKPEECKLFARVCTPDNPLGACMVSSEGGCAAVYAYGGGLRR